MTYALRATLTVLLFSTISAPASALTINFEEFSHGQIIRDSQGVEIRTTNLGGGPDMGVSFDTNVLGTADPDLQFHSSGIHGGENGWKGGNIALDTDLGQIMIIQENRKGCGESFCLDPDDERSRPGGTIEFDYSAVGPFTDFQMDVIDIGISPLRAPSSVDFFMGAVLIQQVGFADFVKPDVIFGDNSANHLDIVSGIRFDRVVVRLGGSGGIDNVTANAVPEPSAALLFLVGAVAVRTGIRKSA
jgi:hypothetical protein